MQESYTGAERHGPSYYDDGNTGTLSPLSFNSGILLASTPWPRQRTSEMNSGVFRVSEALINLFAYTLTSNNYTT